MGERSVRIREVKGSNPSRSTNLPHRFCTMRRFFCLKNFGRPCRAPNPEVGCEPGGVVNIRPCKQLVADLPPLAPGDILLHGHTHVPAWTDFGQGNLYLNPGSVSIPKENTAGAKYRSKPRKAT